MDEDSDGYLTRDEFSRFVNRFDGRLAPGAKKRAEAQKNDPLFLIEIRNKIAGRLSQKVKKTRKKVLITKSTVGDGTFDAFGW
jgi:hypothetical protein